MSAESEHDPRTAVSLFVWPVGEDHDHLYVSSSKSDVGGLAGARDKTTPRKGYHA